MGAVARRRPYLRPRERSAISAMPLKRVRTSTGAALFPALGPASGVEFLAAEKAGRRAFCPALRRRPHRADPKKRVFRRAITLRHSGGVRASVSQGGAKTSSALKLSAGAGEGNRTLV